jgi:Lrp/AsnC family transcriptional regulator for asnA, asnC and gidA
MKTDKTNIEIIRHLRDGRKSYKKIADELGLTESTVRTRVGKLIRDGLLEIAGLVDPELIPGHELVLVGVKLNTMNLVKKGEEFSKLKGVVSVKVVTGRYDLIITVLLNEGFKLLDFYKKEVNTINGVHSVETFVVYKGFNSKIPYLL